MIPHVQSDTNIRIPDLAVTCSGYGDRGGGPHGSRAPDRDPSPGNARAETWANVWAYTTIPSVQEILVVRTASIGAELLRREPDGTWPKRPALIEDGALALSKASDIRVTLPAIYRTTRLARR